MGTIGSTILRHSDFVCWPLAYQYSLRIKCRDEGDQIYLMHQIQRCERSGLREIRLCGMCTQAGVHREGEAWMMNGKTLRNITPSTVHTQGLQSF